ncbi:hypothetical protein RDWZM_008382 [Blomia tropicalis]|uniref:Uncharacterized protein n=1 Tax=Blomia tropicalis TaxID=40697 RepID=A0A9Q0RKA7_BLOTA|nr:hypothetical protein RDWZM_008382 [Blomia tropicalis]
MHQQRRFLLIALIIFALFGSNLHHVNGDDESGPIEPGQNSFLNEGMEDPESPPEPGQINFTATATSTRPTIVFITTQAPSEYSTTQQAFNRRDPLEPSNNHEFVRPLPPSPPEPSNDHQFSRITPPSPPEPSNDHQFSRITPPSPPEPSNDHQFSRLTPPSPPSPPEPSNTHRFTTSNQDRRYYNLNRQTVPNRSNQGYVYDPRRQGYMPLPSNQVPNVPNHNHLRPHTPIMVNRYDRPFTSQIWRCNMQTNNCFLRNKHNFQPLLPQFFQGSYALVLDVGKAALNKHSKRRPNPVVAYNAARMETIQYFDPQYQDACLAFSYYWNGIGKKAFYMLQRNTEDVCIYSAQLDPNDQYNHGVSGQWQDIQLQLDLGHGSSKFWLEWVFDIDKKRQYGDYQDLGYIAVRNFSIGYGTCQFNYAKQCDIPDL